MKSDEAYAAVLARKNTPTTPAESGSQSELLSEKVIIFWKALDKEMKL